MNAFAPAVLRRCLASLLVAGTLAVSALRAADAPPVVDQTSSSAPVTLADDGNSWTLDNGIVKATINQRNGSMPSLVYHGINTMGGNGGTWEQTPSGDVTRSVTIDPAKNGGQRAEVSVKGVNGRMDIEVRYALERGASGIYAYAIFSHGADYPAAGEGESRYITRLNQDFNWISVDLNRNQLECTPADWGAGVVVHAKEQRILSTGYYKNSVEHKYSYNAVQYKIPAYGWSSTKDHIGVWFINPTTEYLSGGASKLELVCHFDADDNPTPIILDYWCAGHYAGGAGCNIPDGEVWNKVIGPIFVYVNALSDPQTASAADLATLEATAGNPTVPAAWQNNANALFQNALAQAKIQKALWPYDWVNGVDYPHKDQRGNVSGQLVLNDPQAATTKLPHLTVGLAHPDYTSSAGGFILRSGNGNLVTWPHDGNYYQFWTDGSDDGNFSITNVRPGNYTLHAFSTGVLGDFAQTDIAVLPGKTVDLGKLIWKPVRDGRQLWEIGYPDRTGDKFFKGDGSNNWLWGWNLRYALLFPNDITYTIGKSDYRKDWFFEEVPHATNLSFVNPEAKDPANQRFGWVKAESLAQYPQTNQRGPWDIYGTGRTTVWTVKFHLPTSARGVAYLRVALAGVNGLRDGLAVGLNGQSIGAIGDGSDPDNARLITTNSIRYNADKGLNQQRTLKFEASLLKSGENSMTFTVPGGDLQSGVVWDYIRLELDEKEQLSSQASVR